MSASCSVYWYCVREARPPMRTSCAACRIQPRALHFLELRPQPRDDPVGAGVALVERFQRDEHAPVVDGRAAAEPPIDIAIVSTPGSAWTILPSASWSSTIFEKDTSCGPSEIPVMRPVSCCGKKPFGMMAKR